jgi:hypothetical protein
MSSQKTPCGVKNGGKASERLLIACKSSVKKKEGKVSIKSAITQFIDAVGR